MKIRTIVSLLILLTLGQTLKAQDAVENPIKKLFLDQLSLFPQEKIYVQTDRSEYLEGEIIWFRAHLVDAVFLKQANASRYVYIELINPLNKIVERIKLKPDSTGCFYGNLRLGDELGEGGYLLRAYTRYMQNQGSDYFFTRPIYVTNPVSAKIAVEINYSADGNAVNAGVNFTKRSGVEKIVPDQCVVCHGGTSDENKKEISFKGNTGHFTLSAKELNKDRKFLLQAVIDGQIYKKYFEVPYLEKTFDVSFFPEGGYAPMLTHTTMAFKSINTDGLSEEVKGQIFDDQSQLCAEFESSHLGMGSFNMYYSPERKYYAVCTNKENVSKRFNLPQPSDNAVALKTVWEHNKLLVTILKSPNCQLQPETQLVAHIRGVPIYAEQWDAKREYITFDENFFPAGIVHLLLIDKDRNILSERLVFSSQKSTFAKTNVELDKEKYKARDKINMSIHVTDENKEPLSGNFSLSVVDTKDVSVDTTSTIISTLLLSSELKGNIESPMSYLQKDNKKSAAAFDVLLMTQGWRRYDIPNLLKGKPTKDLKYSVELGEDVSGKSEGLFSSLKDGHITLLALKDSVIGTSYTKPDSKGDFVFKNLEYPQGTRYIIQANTIKGSGRVFLEMDTLRQYPPLNTSVIMPKKEIVLNDTYLANSVKKYNLENGMRTYNLAELTVTANRKSNIKTESPYYSIMSSMVITAEDVDKWKLLSVYDLLRRIPGVTVSGSNVLYRGNTPMLLLDNVPTENIDYDMLVVDDIQDAFATPGTTMGVIFGSRGANGAIVINTKKGFIQTKRMSSNIKYLNASGFQQPTQFYSPVYRTDLEKNNGKPDFRTTIYWNPNVQIGADGMMNLSFYSADTSSKYTVLLEGVDRDGHLIYFSGEKISVTGEH